MWNIITAISAVTAIVISLYNLHRNIEIDKKVEEAKKKAIEAERIAKGQCRGCGTPIHMALDIGDKNCKYCDYLHWDGPYLIDFSKE